MIAGALAAQSGGSGVVVHADDARVVVSPSTVPPVPSSPPPQPDASTPSGSTQEGVAGSFEWSVPAEPDDVARPIPVGLLIDTIDVDQFAVREVGLEADGWLELPGQSEIGWYKYGATAGRPGATVLAAHVNWNGAEGPFAHLGLVEPGDEIEVTLDDGSARSYQVTERATYDKSELPNDRLWRNTGPEELVLITCGGDFNPDLRSYTSNIVVYAVPTS